MSKSFRIDLTGQRFGKLTVLEFVPNDKQHSYWKCKCDCGNITIVQSNSLKKSRTISCGCNKGNSSHKMSGTRLYMIWKDMKKRCCNPKHKDFPNYGGRKISICLAWINNFIEFRDWAMANGYDDTLTIDRIDVNGNYEPNNCRWVDKKTQVRNRRNTRYIEYQGKQMPLAEVSELTNINYRALESRYYKRGDRGEKLIRPIKEKN